MQGRTRPRLWPPRRPCQRRTELVPWRPVATILPWVPGEVRGPLRSLPAPPIGVTGVCGGSRTLPPMRTRGAQELRTPGARDHRVIPGSGKQSARKTLGLLRLPRLGAAPHFWRRASGQAGGPWRPSPLLFSLFFGGRNFGISMRYPPGSGSVGPSSLPRHTPVPVGIKKRTKPPNRGYPELISWDREGIKGLDHPGSLLKTQTGWSLLHSPSLALPTASRSAQVPAAGPSPLTSQDRRRLRQRPGDRWREMRESVEAETPGNTERQKPAGAGGGAGRRTVQGGGAWGPLWWWCVPRQGSLATL